MFDKNVSQTTDAYGNTTFSYELSAPEGGWASDTTVRFSVSNRMNDRDGTSRRASEAAAVVVRPARPVPAVSDVATTSAKVAWENTAQSDRYAVFWTEDMTATLDALETGLAEVAAFVVLLVEPRHPERPGQHASAGIRHHGPDARHAVQGSRRRRALRRPVVQAVRGGAVRHAAGQLA